MTPRVIDTLAIVALGALAVGVGFGDIAEANTLNALILGGLRWLLLLVPALVVLSALRQRRWPDVAGALVVPSVVWLAVNCLSAAAAPSHRADALAALERPVSGVLLAASVCALSCDRQRWLHVLKATATGGLIVALTALAEATGASLVLDWLAQLHDGAIPIGDVPRVAATLSHPNVAAMLLELTLPLLIGWAWSTARASWRLALWLAAAATLLAIVLTFSRAGIAAALAALGVLATIYLALGRQHGIAAGRLACGSPHGIAAGRLAFGSPLGIAAIRLARGSPLGIAAIRLARGSPLGIAAIRLACGNRHRLAAVCLALGSRHRLAAVCLALGSPLGIAFVRLACGSRHRLILIGSLILLVPMALGWASVIDPGLSRRLFAGVDESSPIQPPRTEFWAVALDMAHQQPWLGVGPDNFRWRFADYSGVPADNLGIHAHNQYLEALADTGVLGVACLAWLLVSFVRTATARLRAAAADDWPWRAALLASLSAWLLHALLDDFERFWPTSTAFWLIAGLTIARPSPQPGLNLGQGDVRQAARREAVGHGAGNALWPQPPPSRQTVAEDQASRHPRPRRDRHVRQVQQAAEHADADRRRESRSPLRQRRDGVGVDEQLLE